MSLVMFFSIQAIFILSIVLLFYLISRVTAGDSAREAPVPVRADDVAADLPRFFCKEESTSVRGQEMTIDDLVVERLEGYLRLEHARAEEFVSEPSIARLYRDTEHRFLFN